MSKEFRMERIEKLLYELTYEITRGLHENEIDETMEFSKIHGKSRSIPDGVVRMHFSVRPIPRWHLFPSDHDAKLKIVK